MKLPDMSSSDLMLQTTISVTSDKAQPSLLCGLKSILIDISLLRKFILLLNIKYWLLGFSSLGTKASKLPVPVDQTRKNSEIDLFKLELISPRNHFQDLANVK